MLPFVLDGLSCDVVQAAGRRIYQDLEGIGGKVFGTVSGSCQETEERDDIDIGKAKDG